jgi:hypothetical protein
MQQLSRAFGSKWKDCYWERECAKGCNTLTGIRHDNHLSRGTSHNLFANMCPATTLYQNQVGIELVRAIHANVQRHPRTKRNDI